MPDVQEVFHMATQKVRPDPGFVDRQFDRRRRRARNRKIGGYVVAGAIGITALALVLREVPGGESSAVLDAPAGSMPDQAPAREAAVGFITAYGAFDADAALGYLAEDAVIATGDGTPRALRLQLAWFQAMGYEQHVGPCMVTSEGPIDVVIECPYDFQALRSEQIGLGPYRGSAFTFTIRDGEIVRFDAGLNYTGRFSAEMWEPFAEWVSTNHPEDVAIMYTDGSLSDGRLTPESIRLWEERSKGYVRGMG